MKPRNCHGMMQEELRFFGKISASVAHEIKNKLAIIKEESGLINDLFQMAQKGRPVDLNRIEELAKKIPDRVDMVDEIVKRLSRFAHSVEEFHRTFDLSEIAALTAGLCQRFAAMKKVRVELCEAPFQVQITGNPFLVEHVIFLLLDIAMTAAGEGGAVTVKVREAEGSALIIFNGFPIIDSCNPAANAELRALLEELTADVSVEIEPPQITLILPKDLGDI